MMGTQVLLLMATSGVVSTVTVRASVDFIVVGFDHCQDACWYLSCDSVEPVCRRHKMSHYVLEMTCSTFTLSESSSVLPRQGDTAQFSAPITRTHDLRRPSVCFFLPPTRGGRCWCETMKPDRNLSVRFKHDI